MKGSLSFRCQRKTPENYTWENSYSQAGTLNLHPCSALSGIQKKLNFWRDLSDNNEDSNLASEDDQSALSVNFAECHFCMITDNYPLGTERGRYTQCCCESYAIHGFQPESS